MSNTTPAGRLEEQLARHRTLADQRVAITARLEGSRTRLEELRRKAEETWGTSDPQALKKKLQEMTASNDAAVTTFIADLDRIEAALKEAQG